MKRPPSPVSEARLARVLAVFEADAARRWTREEVFMRVRHEMTRVQVAATITALRAAAKIDWLGPDRWQLAAATKS